jgi:DNA-binding NarL/FixJ family response regulator
MNTGEQPAAAGRTVGEPIRVLVVEDDRRLREWLRLLIDGSAPLACVGHAGSIAEALRLPAATRIDVLLVDVQLPGTWGSEGVATLLERWPQAVALMHSSYDDDDLVFASLCNGAVGYVLKRTAPAKLLEAIHETFAGGAPMSPEIARRVITRFRSLRPPERGDAKLSPQELRLLAALAEGTSYAEAATTLGVTVNTVRTHIRSIYDKLHVHSKSAAVSKALRTGLI